MKNSKLPYLLIVLLTIWCFVLSSILYNNYKENTEKEVINEYDVSGFSTDFTKVIDEHKASIVTINCDGTISSGFVYKQIDKKVYILTSYHGVTGSHINVSFSNVYSTKASLIDKDQYLDLAVLEIETPYNIETLSLGDSSIVSSGEFVITIGTPSSSDLSGSVEMGMISADNRVIENSITIDEKVINYYLDVLQLSGNLQSGYSGSPVINMNGEIIGMVTMNATNNINFAITANEIKYVADKIINQEELSKYQFGIKGKYIKDMDNYVKANLNIAIDTISGLYVDKVMDSSIASSVGIRSGDIVLTINDIDINDINDYFKAAYTKAEIIKFVVLRGQDKVTLLVNNDA